MKLLVDVSNLAYRAAYKLSLSDKAGNMTNVIYGVLHSLERIAKEQKPTELVLCFDGGSAARYKIYPEYKAQRHKSDSSQFARGEVSRQLPLLQELVESLPVICLKCVGVEADDIIGIIADISAGERVGIVSSDHDLYQLAKPPRRVIVNPGTGETVKLTMKPKHYLWSKVLVGDPSDNITGIPRVGVVGAKKLIAEHRTLKGIMLAAKEADKLGSVCFADALSIVRRNMRLMKIGDVITDSEKISVLNQYQAGRKRLHLDQDRFRKDLLALGFISTVSRLSSFLVPFRSIKKASESEKNSTKSSRSEKARTAKRIRVTVSLQKEAPNAVSKRSPNKSTRRATQTDNGVGSVSKGLNRGAEVETGVFGTSSRSKGMLETPEIHQRRLVRRTEALHILRKLQWSKDVRAYVNKLPRDDKYLVKQLAAKLEPNNDLIPSKNAVIRLQQIHHDYTMELPEWAK